MAISLQIEEAMASSSWRKSKSDSTVTMRGVILSPTTTCLSPKPASHTGTSTSECPLRGGTQRRTCRTAGGASLQRGTPTTPTSGKAAPHRGTRHRATALSAHIVTIWLSRPFIPREGPPSLRATLALSHLLTAPRGSHHVVPLSRHPVGPARLAEEGPGPHACLRPRGLSRLTDEWTRRIRGTATMMQGKRVAEDQGAHLQTSTVWTRRNSTGI